jgi:uncharacterized membrane protein YqaE (UPF0057 family)
MKKLTLLSLTGPLLALFLCLSSCSNMGGLTLEKRHYGRGYYVHVSGENESKKSAPSVSETPTLVINSATGALPTESFDGASLMNTQTAPLITPLTTHTFFLPKKTPSSVKNQSKASERKRHTALRTNVKKHLFGHTASGEADTQTILLVILALLVAPLAVYLKEGISGRFWLDLICYLLGGGLFFVTFFGGGGLLLFAIIFALLIVFDII